MKRRVPRASAPFALLLFLALPGLPGCGGTGLSSAGTGKAVPAVIAEPDTGAVDPSVPSAPLPPQVLPASSCRQAWSDPKTNHRFNPDSPAEAYSEYLRRIDRGNCHKEWTVLVYMAADNDLTPYALWDLYEMEAGYKSGRQAAGSTLRSDVVVELDTAGSDEGVRRLHMFQREEAYDPALGIGHFRAMSADGIRSPVVSRRHEHAAGASHERRFRDFVEWGIRNYPSKRYMVVVWGHGQGWRGEARASHAAEAGAGRFGGIGFDDSDGGYLTVPALRRALGSISRDVLGGREIDVYAADSCLMQMLEVAHEIAPHVRYIVGSTQVQNYLGLPYRRILHELNTGRLDGQRPKFPSADESFLVARMIPRLFKASFTAWGLQGRHSPEAIREITMSALSSPELTGLFVPALERFSSDLAAYLAGDPDRAAGLQHLVEHAPKFMGGAQDLGIFLGLLKRDLSSIPEPTAESLALLASLDALKDALERVVLAYAHGTRFEDPEDPFFLPGWFRAVSLWAPAQASEYTSRIEDFRSSTLYARVPGWEEWMKIIYPLP